MSALDHMLEPKTVRRMEVITWAGGRRRFPDDEKARIVEATLVPRAVVLAVAARLGMPELAARAGSTLPVSFHSFTTFTAVEAAVFRRAAASRRE